MRPVGTFEPGMWVQWEMNGRTLRGEVIEVKGISVVIDWLGVGPQVFPNIATSGPEMHRILRPKDAVSIRRDTKRGRMTIPRAAAQLGKTTKQVRAMLRSGKLEGEQRDGKWVRVYLES